MLNIKAIKNQMEILKISKIDLCNATGMARTTFDSILKGGDTKISTIESIAAVLKMPVKDLFLTSPREEKVEHGDTSIEINENCSNPYSEALIEALQASIRQMEDQLKDKQTIIELLKKQK